MKKLLSIICAFTLILGGGIFLSACGDPANNQDGATSGLKFALTENNTYSVTGIGTAKETDIVIPSEYKGLPVTEIGYSSFDGENIVSLTMPDTITIVKGEAFKDCISLTSIKFSDNLASIGRNAFLNCSSLTELTIPDSVTKIEEDAFHGCENVTTLKLSANCSSHIGDIFNGQKVKDITATAGAIDNFRYSNFETVTIIGEDEIPSSFMWGNNSLKKVILPSTITKIGREAFYYCDNLEDIYFNGTLEQFCNIEFESRDTLQYTDNLYINNELVIDVVVPDGITKIGENFLAGYKKLNSVVLPDSVIELSGTAFFKCENLTSLKMGANISSEDNKILDQCNNLQELTITSELLNKVDGGGSIELPKLQTLTIVGDTLEIEDTLIKNLKNLYISQTVTQIGAIYVSSIENTYFMGGLEEWCNITVQSTGDEENYILPITENFYIDGEIVEGDLVIPDGVTNLEEYSFYGLDITTLKVPDSVTEMGSYAFCNSKNLVKVELPANEGVASIFHGCDNIKEITTPLIELKGFKNLEVANINLGTVVNSQFNDCANLKTIILADTFTEIGQESFKNCPNLENISFGKNLKKVGRRAFINTTNIKNVYYNGGLEDWLAIEFNTAVCGNLYIQGELLTDLVIPAGITTINAYAFCYNYGLKTAVIGEDVTYISEHAFDSCSNLTTLTLMDSITDISANAFTSCNKIIEVYDLTNLDLTTNKSKYNGIGLAKVIYTSLSSPSIIRTSGDYEYFNYAGTYYLLSYIGTEKNITLPTSLGGGDYEIYSCAFYGNEVVESVNVPNGVTKIGESAFRQCPNLKEVNVSGEVEYIDTWAFEGSKNLATVVLEEGVKEIGGSVFSNSGVQNLVIPESVVSIGASSNFPALEYVGGVAYVDNWVFYSDEFNLSEVSIREGTIGIARNAFSHRSSLTSLTLPSTLRYIGNQAFYSCSNLTSITIPSSVVLIENQAFADSGLTSAKFQNTSSWFETDDIFATSGTTINSSTLSNLQSAAQALVKQYYNSWKRV